MESTSVLISFFSSFAEEPPRFIEEPRTVIAKHHTKIVMRCEVEPKSADIRWIRNDKYINTNLEQGIEIEGGVLIVLSFKHTKKFKHHVGTYQCVANNTAGAIRSKPAQLLRAGKTHLFYFSPVLMRFIIINS